MIKRTFSIFSFIFFSTYFLVAQSVNQSKNIASIRISIADTSHNTLLLKQEKLKEIWGMFQNEKLYGIRFLYQDPNNEYWNSEFYDMNFEGDIYVFKNKYKNSIRFVKPKIDVQQIYGKTIECMGSKQLRTIIRKDSVIFDFNLECLREDKRRNIPDRTELGVPAKYSGDLTKLCSTIEKQLVEINSTVGIDSIIVFRGVVDVNGDMSNLILEAGKPSVFSDAVKNVLTFLENPQTLRKRKIWVPARIERGPVKSNIRIYVKLTEDGSVTMSTTQLLGTISVLEDL